MPQHVMCDRFIGMAQHIADIRYFAPGHLGVTAFQFSIKMTAGLRDDFKTALNDPALASVGAQGVDGHAIHFRLNEFDGFDYVAEAKFYGSGCHSENADGRLLDRLPQTGMKTAAGHDVGGMTKNAHRCFFHVHKFVKA